MFIHKKVSSLRLFVAYLFLASGYGSIFPFRTSSRNFSNLENPTFFKVKKKHQLVSSFFATSASSASKRNEELGTLMDVWGTYNFKNLIESKKLIDPAFQSPLVAPASVFLQTLQNRDLIFNVAGEIKTAGLSLAYDYKLGNCTIPRAAWFVGFSIPFVSAQTNVRYLFSGDEANPSGLTDAQKEEIDTVRRLFHEQNGLQNNVWSKEGLGDIDLHLTWAYHRDHWLLMKSVTIQNRFGVLIAAGSGYDFRYPSSIPLMGSNHNGIFDDIVLEFELRQDWKLSSRFGWLWQFANSHLQRVPVFKEPAPFSSLIKRMYEKPGNTFIFSPAFTLENVLEGVNAQVGYAFIRHLEDTLIDDQRGDDAVRTFLNPDAQTFVNAGVQASFSDLIDNIAHKQSLTRWTSHAITLDVMYDPNQILNNWRCNPVIFFNYVYPLGGFGVVKTNEIKFGLNLHF